ncbi:MAG TPA: DUF1622 domain-containing protein [Gemmatimonadaceae bacterium]|nr:DUF1622 domain-containing protein [Gemmatimonadaceae bacterium]
MIALLASLQDSPATAKNAAQAFVVEGAEWIRLALEAAGVVIIAVGAVAALALLIGAALAPRKARFSAARLTLARYLVLALEFQLASDIVATAIAPEWQEIAELAAIATIRTALNYFLSREIREEREHARAETATASRGASSPPDNA